MTTDDATRTPRGLLTLLGLRGVGPQTTDRLATRFATIAAARDGIETVGASPAIVRILRDDKALAIARDRADDILDQTRARGVEVLTIYDAAYPTHLLSIPDRPLILYARGKLPPNRRCIACIGTREPSKFGQEVTRRIVAILAERGWSIISGLAIGVDSLAHEAALEAKGHTVAILANGLDSVYPRVNAALAERILDAGGAWLSEQPFGTPAVPRNLVQRDRLQSGMSIGTIVMQTDVVGGSMHTVRFTLLQQRLLFAPVPRGVHATEPKSQGILALVEKTGMELAKLLDAQGTYADLLASRYAKSPVASPLAGRDEYERLLEVLDAAATDEKPRAAESQLGLSFGG